MEEGDAVNMSSARRAPSQAVIFAYAMEAGGNASKIIAAVLHRGSLVCARLIHLNILKHRNEVCVFFPDSREAVPGLLFIAILVILLGICILIKLQMEFLKASFWSDGF